MPNQAWTGLGLAEGSALDSGNTNASGNGDAITYIALSGTIGRVTDRDALGNGLAITGAAVGSTARLDTITLPSEGQAFSFRYPTPASNPGTDYHILVQGRNTNSGFTGYFVHKTDGVAEFRNSGNTVVSGGASVALTPGHVYDIDGCFIRNTLTTPSTTNGRIIGRIKSVSAPGTWNGGAEFYIDTGYTVNTTVDTQSHFRFGKLNTAGSVADYKMWNWKWRDLATPVTSTVKANAITNFVQSSSPATLSQVGTGKYYVIYEIGTAGAGGTLTYSIVQTDGNPQTPVVINPENPGVPKGIWRVVPDQNGDLEYLVTLTETGNDPVSHTVVVPQDTSDLNLFQRKRRVGNVWVS